LVVDGVGPDVDGVVVEGAAPEPVVELLAGGRVPDVDRMGHPVEGQALEDAGEAEAMVAVEVGDADAGDGRRRHAGQEQLALGALAGVEQHSFGVPAQEVAVVVAVAGGGLAGRPQHDELPGGHGPEHAPSQGWLASPGMEDDAVLGKINNLVAEEHRLLESSRGTEGLSEKEEAHLEAAEVDVGEAGRRPAVEDDRDVAAGGRPPCGQRPGEAHDGGVEVAPPTVRTGADDVHPVDQVPIHPMERRGRSVRAMSDIRGLFCGAVDATTPLLAEPALIERFDGPSALAEFSVRGLAGHLLRAMTSAEGYLDRPEPAVGPGTGTGIISAAEYYAAIMTGATAINDPAQQAIRQRGVEAAPAEPRGFPAVWAETADRLRSRLAAEARGRLALVIGDRGLTLYEYFGTWLVELFVLGDGRAVARMDPIPVTAPGDPRLDDYRPLHDARAPRRMETEGAGPGFFVAEGGHALERLLASGRRVRSVLVDRIRLEALRDRLAGLD